MPKYNLTLLYFDIAGKAEAIRLALAYAHLEFENKFIKDYDEFLALKKDKLPFGQLPALHVKDNDSGTESYIVQTPAILRFIGKISNVDLYPEDPVLFL